MHSFLRLFYSIQSIQSSSIIISLILFVTFTSAAVLIFLMRMFNTNKSNTNKSNNNFIIPNAKRGITKRYKILNVIGRGCFGTVRKVQDKKTKQFFACKTISKKDPNEIPYYLIRREVECLRQVRNHPHLIQIHDVYEDTDFVHIVTELCTGSELYHRIVTSSSSSSSSTTTTTTTTWDNITTKEIVQLLYNITHAIAYCHENGFVHRDLKAPNFMFTNIGTNTNIKIIDFGLAKCFLPPDSPQPPPPPPQQQPSNNNNDGDDEDDKPWLLRSKVGTPYYVAPEVLVDDIYSPRCDVWSIGIIAYLILSKGKLPFQGKDERETIQLLKDYNNNKEQEELIFEPKEIWDDIPEMTKEFVRTLLQKDPNNRPTAAEVLELDWFKLYNNNIIVPQIIIQQQEEEKERSSSSSIGNILNNPISIISSTLPSWLMGGIRQKSKKK